MLHRSILAAVGALSFLATTPALHAADEFVYVESNIKTANGNSIYAFKRQADGSLRQIAGSPFLTGGAGVQDTSLNVGPYDADQVLIANPEHTLLYAVNPGSDTIAGFHIQPDGSLKPVVGSPFPSGGTNPVSLALRDNILFVVNKNGDFARQSGVAPNYTTLRVENDGVLTPNPSPSATASVSLGSSPSQALLSPYHNVLFGADFLGGVLQSMQFDAEGRLFPLPPQALPASEYTDTTTPRLPLGLWAHPTLPLLYVGFVTDSRLGVYHYANNGLLHFDRSVPNSGKAICWLRTNRAGTRLYSSETITNSVSVYDLSDPYNPTPMENLVLDGPGNALQIGFSTDEQYLYAISSRGSSSIPDGQGNALHILKVESDGTVNETAQSPVLFSLPAGVRPQGILTVEVR